MANIVPCGCERGAFAQGTMLYRYRLRQVRQPFEGFPMRTEAEDMISSPAGTAGSSTMMHCRGTKETGAWPEGEMR